MPSENTALKAPCILHVAFLLLLQLCFWHHDVGASDNGPALPSEENYGQPATAWAVADSCIGSQSATSESGVWAGAVSAVPASRPKLPLLARAARIAIVPAALRCRAGRAPTLPRKLARGLREAGATLLEQGCQVQVSCSPGCGTLRPWYNVRSTSHARGKADHKLLDISRA